MTLLAILFGVLLVAGGASRADVAGQTIVRGVTWLLLIVAILVGPRPVLSPSVRPVVWLLGAALLLAAVQLIPLPPLVWQALPGRAPLEVAARLGGQPEGWRPLSLVPGATINALSSLIVPVAALLFASGLAERERGWAPTLLLAVIVGSAALALLQVTGAAMLNPLLNGDLGQVSGSFANRNHFALFMACGCVLAPLWAFRADGRPGWRLPVAAGLILLFLLLILASGSRAGLGLGLVGLAAGVLLVRRPMKRELRRYPRWVLPAVIAAIVLVPIILVGVSMAENRAASIDRIFAVDQGEDMRSRGLPTVLAMARAYFPIGSGLGGFDPIFRMHEPFELLKLTYFNHAHNDFLEIAIDAGLPGLALLLTALGWWLFTSVRAWRDGEAGAEGMRARAGAALLLLVLVASGFDYPARTPMVMAMIVVAAIWLGQGGSGARSVSFTAE